jgi:hypothetical protein
MGWKDERRTRRHWGSRVRSAEGCTAWLATCVVSLILFAINVAICQDVYNVLQRLWWPRAEPQVKQAVLLVVPAVLLFLEVWIWELLAERFSAR